MNLIIKSILIITNFLIIFELFRFILKEKEKLTDRKFKL